MSETDTVQKNGLMKDGFAYQADADRTFVYEKDQIALPQIDLPAGFMLTSQKEDADAQAVDKQRFFSFNPGATYDEGMDRVYQYNRKNPFLVPELQIVLLNEHGNPISSCMGY